MAKLENHPTFQEMHRLIHGCFSIVMLSLRGIYQVYLFFLRNMFVFASVVFEKRKCWFVRISSWKCAYLEAGKCHSQVGTMVEENVTLQGVLGAWGFFEEKNML